MDFLTKKRVKNGGQIQQYHIEENHEAIIDPLVWEAEQHEHQRRNNYREEHGLNALLRTPEANPFTGKVICGTCNQSFRRRGWKTGERYRNVWQCQECYRAKGVQGCTNRHVDEAILEQAFKMAWNALIDNRDEIKERWETIAEFGNPLEQFRGVQFADITEKAKHITDFKIDFMLKTLDHITVFESGKLVVTFMDGTVIECNGE